MSGKNGNKDMGVTEEIDLEKDQITGEITMDRVPEREAPVNLVRVKKMLYNRLAQVILDYDLTRNEAVAYLLYEDGYTNIEVVNIMSQLFKKNFWRQNVNDYRRKALMKIEAVRDGE